MVDTNIKIARKRHDIKSEKVCPRKKLTMTPASESFTITALAHNTGF